MHRFGRLLGLILLTSIVAHAQSGARNQPPQGKEPGMESVRNKEMIRSMYEDCLNKRNFGWIGESISEDYTGPGGEKGPAGFERVIKGLLLGFPDIRWTVEDLIAEGDRVVVRWTWNGTHTGAFAGYPASGKRLENKAVAIYQFREGRIVNAWMQSDRLGFLQQLGAVPQDVLPAAPAPRSK